MAETVDVILTEREARIRENNVTNKVNINATAPSQTGNSGSSARNSLLGPQTKETGRPTSSNTAFRNSTGNGVEHLDDTGSDDEVEELLVFANFSNHLSIQELKDKEANIKFIGLDSGNPLAEVNGAIFSGTYDYSLGTSVFFEKDNNTPTPNALFEEPCQQLYKCVHKTNKVINFKQIYIEKNTQKETTTNNRNEQHTNNEDNSTNLENLKTLQIDVTYDEAINSFPDKNVSKK